MLSIYESKIHLRFPGTGGDVLKFMDESSIYKDNQNREEGFGPYQIPKHYKAVAIERMMCDWPRSYWKEVSYSQNQIHVYTE